MFVSQLIMTLNHEHNLDQVDNQAKGFYQAKLAVLQTLSLERVVFYVITIA